MKACLPANRMYTFPDPERINVRFRIKSKENKGSIKKRNKDRINKENEDE
jgi:hypothetical protein